MSTARIEPVSPVKPIRKTIRARRRAPRHPVKPERRLRKAVRDLFAAYHSHLVDIVMAWVRRKKQIALADGQDDLRGVLKSAKHFGDYLYNHGPFKKEVARAAAETTESARKQTSKALGRSVETDLSKQDSRFRDWISGDVEDRMADSLTRSADIFAEWDSLDEDSEYFEDEEDLERQLDKGLDGIVGSALAYASMAFSGAFSDMIKASQVDAGVSTYTWLTQLDSHVRPSHEALDGETCSWDDPPLQPGEEPLGDPAIDKPAHPGESPNCRCVASPEDPDSDNDS